MKLTLPKYLLPRIYVRLEPDVKRQFKDKVRREGKTIQTVLEELIYEYLKRGENEN